MGRGVLRCCVLPHAHTQLTWSERRQEAGETTDGIRKRTQHHHHHQKAHTCVMQHMCTVRPCRLQDRAAQRTEQLREVIWARSGHIEPRHMVRYVAMRPCHSTHNTQHATRPTMMSARCAQLYCQQHRQVILNIMQWRASRANACTPAQKLDSRNRNDVAVLDRGMIEFGSTCTPQQKTRHQKKEQTTYVRC